MNVALVLPGCLKRNVATGISVFDFELFVGARFRTTVGKLSWLVILLFGKLLHFYIPPHLQRRHTTSKAALVASAGTYTNRNQHQMLRVQPFLFHW